MASSVDPDETTHYKSSRLVLHCLQKYICWCTGLKLLRELYTFRAEAMLSKLNLRSFCKGLYSKKKECVSRL